MALSSQQPVPLCLSLAQKEPLSLDLKHRRHVEASQGSSSTRGHLQEGALAPKKRDGRSGSLIVSFLYLIIYFTASPLLCLCNKRLFGGPAKDLPLCCCLLQQLILCGCLLLSSLAGFSSQQQQQQQEGFLMQRERQQQHSQQEQQQQQQQQQQLQQHLVSKGTANRSCLPTLSFKEQLQLAVPYVLMLWSSNCCLAVSSLSSYQIARCSAVPVALLLEILGLFPSHPSAAAAAAATAAAAAATATATAAERTTEGDSRLGQLLCRLVETAAAIRDRAQAVGLLRAFSALAVAAGLAAAAADGEALQPRAAALGLTASVAGTVYMHLARDCIRKGSDTSAATPPAAAAPAAAAAAAAAAAGQKALSQWGDRRDSSEGPWGSSRGRQEAAIALHVASLAALLLMPLAALSQEPQLLLQRLQHQYQQQQQQQQLPVMQLLLLLLLSGCLAASLPVCTYACLRRLSPLACCIAGFSKAALQMLLSPLLARETVSTATSTGCCCCLIGSLAFCISSIYKQKETERRQGRDGRGTED